MEQTKNYFGGVHFNTTILLQSESANKEMSDLDNKLSSILNSISVKAESIKPLIQFLVATLAPTKIYMIHHQEAGINNNSKTRIDLLLIMSGNVGFKELEPIINIACLQAQHVCCSLHHEGSVLEWLRAGHIFYSLHCIPDNLVYDNHSLNYPVLQTKELFNIKQKALQTFNWYFEKAQQFYICAESLYQNQFSPLTMFMLHQSAELTFRAILLSLNGYDKRTHEIRVLMKHVRRCALALSELFHEDSDKDLQIIQVLDKAYLDGRYSPEYVIDESILALAFEKVKLLHITAFRIIEQSLK